MGFLRTAGRGLKSLIDPGPSSGYGYGAMGSFLRGLPGANFDYRREAGWLHDNSVVLAAVYFKTRCFQGTPLMVMKRQRSDHRAIPQYDHEVSKLLRMPTPWYDRSLMMQSILLADDTAGDSYIYKQLDKVGRLARLVYLPWYSIEPKNDKYNPDKSDLVTYYNYLAGERTQEIEMDSIIRIRQGMDPLNLKKGFPPLASALREIVGDNGLATWQSSIIRNHGVPPVMITPDMELEDFDTKKREAIERLWVEKTTGERRGEPIVPNLPLKVQQLAFNAKDLAVDTMGMRGEYRITSLLGLNSMVLGLGSGDKRNTFSNFEQAYSAAWETCLVPTQIRHGEQWSVGLEDYLGPNEFIGFDNSQNRALSEDVDQLHIRAREDYKAGIIDRAMAKIMIGEQAKPEDWGVYATPGGPTGSNDPEQAKEDPAKPDEDGEDAEEDDDTEDEEDAD